MYFAGIHTGGRERGDFPPPPPPPLSKIPPPLNQHKYCNKVVLKHKQQQSDKCCNIKVCICSKTPTIFPKVYSSCQNMVLGTVSWWGGGGGFPPPFRKILYETLYFVVAEFWSIHVLSCKNLASLALLRSRYARFLHESCKTLFFSQCYRFLCL